MDPVRALARPMLASMFVYGGIDALRNPGPKVPAAEGVAQPVADVAPVDLPDDTEQLIKLNAAVQIGAGLLLSTGKLPRLSSLVLAASLVPTTIAGHAFWGADDDAARMSQRVHFLKNVSMMGGLLISAMDTEGRPSVPYRASRAGRRAKVHAGHLGALAAERAALTQEKASHGATQAGHALSSTGHAITSVLPGS